jgi:thiol-disulfide isomerase/thioredoxin
VTPQGPRYNHRMLSRRPALALGAALLLLPACGRAPTAEVRAAPSFDLRDLDGGRATLASFKGKVVVLDFWATWCGPCLAELPEYVKFVEKNRGKAVEVIGVVFDSGEPREIQDFVREHRITYRQLLGTDDMAEAFGGNQGFPTTFVIDAQGLIQLTVLGSTPDKFDRLQKTVDKALGAQG